MRLTNQQTPQPVFKHLAINKLALAIKQQSLILCTAGALIVTTTVSPFVSTAQATLTIKEHGKRQNY
ncbi:MAG: hypothetical protein CR966_02070, partial [Pseudomonadales bacterium]